MPFPQCPSWVRKSHYARSTAREESISHNPPQHDASHCNAPKSCVCRQKPQVIRIQAAGRPETQGATGINSSICCAPYTSCGESIQQSFTSTTTATWSSSVTVGTEITMKESLIVEGLEVKISMSGTWTKGGSDSTSQSISGTDHCDRTDNDNGLTFVRLSCNAVKLTVPVTITYEQCGTISTMPGTVQSTQITSRADARRRSATAAATSTPGASVPRRASTGATSEASSSGNKQTLES